MSHLERRYRKLLLAYPARYRAERGDEIVDTYLQMARPEQRWPDLPDVRDAVVAGLRQHLRATRSAGLADGASVAAVLATATAAMFAAVWLLHFEVQPTSSSYVIVRFGPFLSLGAAVWIGWLAACTAVLTLPRRVARGVVLAALTLTFAVVPLAAFTPYDRPPLLVLLPQAALGVTALGLPNRIHRGARLSVALAVVTAAVFAATQNQASEFGYHWIDRQILAVGAVVLLATSLVVAAAMRGRRGVWTVLFVLPATTLLLTAPLAQVVTDAMGDPNTEWPALAAVSASGVVLTGAVLALAAARRSTHEPAPETDPPIATQAAVDR
jgi:hypothetical protein